ncbi:hypothetical protein FB451DRAFT_1375736 [Mycena latifolia]|nr:hypothetical protein FB451DRAFT_1375736 [Mycena latifolia]
MVNMAWGKAGEELKVVMPITPDIAKLITRRGSQMRGELKTKVRGLVELVFGFESGQNQKIVRKNRQLAEDLKEGMGYCYKAKIIQRSSNLMWSSNRRDEGAMHPELFGPVFPKPAFALVLTAIECSVDEWATGIKTDVAFTSADYRSVYLEHLKCLDEFEKHTAPGGILTNILTRMHNLGRQVLVAFPLLLCAHHLLRFHSGAQPIAPIKKASLSKAVLDAAIREYDEDDNTETDGEDVRAVHRTVYGIRPYSDGWDTGGIPAEPVPYSLRLGSCTLYGCTLKECVEIPWYKGSIEVGIHPKFTNASTDALVQAPMVCKGSKKVQGPRRWPGGNHKLVRSDAAGVPAGS